jgi:hypothetical protein
MDGSPSRILYRNQIKSISHSADKKNKTLPTKTPDGKFNIMHKAFYSSNCREWDLDPEDWPFDWFGIGGAQRVIKKALNSSTTTYPPADRRS